MVGPDIQGCYLAELTVADFAVIEKLHLGFSPGMSVITGETGAGKSMLIEALGVALGGRVSSDWIRAGAERAWVEANFAEVRRVADLSLILEDMGCPLEDAGLSLRRDLQPGRNVTRVNGRVAPGHAVEELRARLVDVHSQEDHVSLLRSREQLAVLDRFGRLLAAREQTEYAVRRLRSVRKELQDLEGARRRTEREASLLRHEVAEIEAAAPRPGEEAELASRRLRLRNAARIRGLLGEARGALGGRGAEQGALELIGDAAMALRELHALDESVPFEEEWLIDVLDGLETLGRALVSYEVTLEDDPGALGEVEGRVLALADLKRKYGATLADVAQYHDDAVRRLELLHEAEDRLGQLQQEEAEAAARAGEIAGALSAGRASAARELGAAVQAQLAELGMPHARFVVQLRERPDPDGLVVAGRDSRVAFAEHGIDEAEFQVATSPGEPQKPLSKAASGGELSRLMLGVKSALAEADPVPVLVFDELDQAVGGRLGHVIGEKLWRLGRAHHVLCVTHLPQVACYGDAHYVVIKEVVDGRARTSVRRLEGVERVEELALMLGGPRAGDAARQGAKELLDRAEDWKRTG